MMNSPRLLLVATKRVRSAATVSAAAAAVPDSITIRSFGSGGGTRGARGHGWWVNYRAGKGGRHLQGDYANMDLEELHAWNDAVFSLGSQFAYMDVTVEPLHQDTGSSSKDGDGGKKSRETCRLVMELATTVFPQATENFTNLLNAEEHGFKLSTLHRVEKKVGLMGGHVWEGMGKCSEQFRMPTSATSMVQTEKLVLSHVPGVVTMLSQRVQEIDSRFMLCAYHAPHLDGKSVAIGRLDAESLEQVQKWESSLITQNGHPTTVVLRITDCGILDEKLEESA